jgi:hypothetical protein
MMESRETMEVVSRRMETAGALTAVANRNLCLTGAAVGSSALFPVASRATMEVPAARSEAPAGSVEALAAWMFTAQRCAVEARRNQALTEG